MGAVGEPTPGICRPSLKIGAWAEMLDTIQRDYILTIGKSHLQSRPVLVISGLLRDESRKRVLQRSQT